MFDRSVGGAQRQALAWVGEGSENLSGVGSSKISRLSGDTRPRLFEVISRPIAARSTCEVDVADLDLAAFIVVTTVEALTHSAVLDRPDILADEKAGACVDEVTRLVLRYLRTPSPPR